MNSLEIEVKFYVSDVLSLRKCILDLGAECKGKVFETNIIFEDQNHNFIKHKSLLRLRNDKISRLTFKSKTQDQDDNFKIFKELEVEVNDFLTMSLILKSIGFHQEQKYEKWRETFIIDKTILCLDTIPFGCFLEIEGSKSDIKILSSKVGINWHKRILMNYLEIFKHLQQSLDLPFADITFNNFENLNINLSKFLHLFEKGHD